MSELSFSPAAYQDLHEILDYISRDNPGAAVQVVEKIEDKCRLLAQAPGLGAACEE